jgi:chromosomal replication initiation ATPase DnaA
VEALLREAAHQATAHEESQRRQLDLETLVRRVGASLGVTPAAIAGRTRQRQVVRARQIVAFLWVEQLGRPASELARAWELSRSNTSWAAKRGSEVIREWPGRIEKWCR